MCVQLTGVCSIIVPMPKPVYSPKAVTAKPACRAWEVEEGATLNNWHSNECAMCGASTAQLVELVIDHDHMTGLIRGRLCRGCNACEAHHVNTPWWIEWRAGLNPAGILGIEEEYEHLIPGQAYFERMKRLPMNDAAEVIAEAVTR